jgi:hypothetical protein
MDTTQFFGFLGSIVVLAMISVAIVNGDKTAKLFGEGSKGFAAVLRAATLQKG